MGWTRQHLVPARAVAPGSLAQGVAVERNAHQEQGSKGNL